MDISDFSFCESGSFPIVVTDSDSKTIYKNKATHKFLPRIRIGSRLDRFIEKDGINIENEENRVGFHTLLGEMSSLRYAIVFDCKIKKEVFRLWCFDFSFFLVRREKIEFLLREISKELLPAVRRLIAKPPKNGDLYKVVDPMLAKLAASLYSRANFENRAHVVDVYCPITKLTDFIKHSVLQASAVVGRPGIMRVDSSVSPYYLIDFAGYMSLFIRMFVTVHKYSSLRSFDLSMANDGSYCSTRLMFFFKTEAKAYLPNRGNIEELLKLFPADALNLSILRSMMKMYGAKFEFTVRKGDVNEMYFNLRFPIVARSTRFHAADDAALFARLSAIFGDIFVRSFKK